jgi:hypothetical protein
MGDKRPKRGGVETTNKAGKLYIASRMDAGDDDSDSNNDDDGDDEDRF